MENTTALLSGVPFLPLVGIDLGGKRLAACVVHWLSAADARTCVDRKLGTVLAAVSVLRPCRDAEGRTILPDASLQALPLEHAERLESEGKVKVVRTDSEVEQHRAAWGALEKEVAGRRDRAHELRAESDALFREAERMRVPVFPWDEAAPDAAVS